MTDLHDCETVDEAARQWVEEAGPVEPEVPGHADAAWLPQQGGNQ